MPKKHVKMDVPETVIFNGKEYKLMGTGKYYLSQARSNKERKNAKGLHVAIWEFYSGKTVPKGYIVHHKDGNPHNNNFENLECISRDEHKKIPKKYTDNRSKLIEILIGIEVGSMHILW